MIIAVLQCWLSQIFRHHEPVSDEQIDVLKPIQHSHVVLQLSGLPSASERMVPCQFNPT